MNYSQRLASLFADLHPRIARILERSLEEREITTEEAEALFRVTGRELYGLIMTADELRRRAVGEIVTYVTVRNINFTNICYTGCRFCAYAKHLNDPEAEWLSLEEVAQRAEEAWRAGATEVCLQGGLHPKMDGHHYRDLVQIIKARAPGIHIHAFSPFEILYGAQRTGLSIVDFLTELREAGLDSMPGTAAEILDEEIRPRLSRNKLTAQQWVEIVKTAHQLGIRTSATIMYGHIDAPRHWAAHLALIRDIQRETGGFTEFVPLGFIHHNAPIYLDGEARAGPSGMDDLRMHAVARIMLHNYLPNIQVSWVKLGPKYAQMCLNAGANDFGGTLMNENISRSAGASHGDQLSPEEFHRLIRDIGRVPAQRSTTYQLIKVFTEGPARSVC